jgi:hypothetical protein
MTNFGNDVNDHRTYTKLGTLMSQATVRNTASGIAWQLDSTASALSTDPLRFPVANIACQANLEVVVSAYLRRPDTNAIISLFCKAAQLTGIPYDIRATCTAAIDTWQQVSFSFTPTQSGVVQIEVELYSLTAAAQTAYIDDLGTDTSGLTWSNFTPVMTGPTTPSPAAVTSSSTHFLPGQPWAFDSGQPWIAFDGATTQWYPAYITTQDEWIKIDLGSSQGPLTRYVVRGSPTQYPREWILEGSDDDASWTQLDSVSGNTSNSVTRDIANTVSYRYYRWTIAEDATYPYGIMTIVEIELWKQVEV